MTAVRGGGGARVAADLRSFDVSEREGNGHTDSSNMNHLDAVEPSGNQDSNRRFVDT